MHNSVRFLVNVNCIVIGCDVADAGVGVMISRGCMFVVDGGNDIF